MDFFYFSMFFFLLFSILNIAAWYAKYEINTFFKIQIQVSVESPEPYRTLKKITSNWLGLQEKP